MTLYFHISVSAADSQAFFQRKCLCCDENKQKAMTVGSDMTCELCQCVCFPSCRRVFEYSERERSENQSAPCLLLCECVDVCLPVLSVLSWIIPDLLSTWFEAGMIWLVDQFNGWFAPRALTRSLVWSWFFCFSSSLWLTLGRLMFWVWMHMWLGLRLDMHNGHCLLMIFPLSSRVFPPNTQRCMHHNIIIHIFSFPSLAFVSSLWCVTQRVEACRLKLLKTKLQRKRFSLFCFPSVDVLLSNDQWELLLMFWSVWGALGTSSL